ncbi:MAG: hypothetical protein IJ306_08520 [Oscillospiraceae bacterium]|nr:hypothetical protein [Oscillospiraceae bacterium]
MRNFVKKTFCLVLAAIMILGNAGIVFAAESEEQNLEEIIKPQIEAFAKSIDQKDADGAAADALAMHGMFKNGKDLRVGESHALTATLVNSELMKAYLTEACVEMIKTTKQLKVKDVYNLNICDWNMQKNYCYIFYIYDYDFKPEKVKETEYLDYLDTTDYVEKFHSSKSPNFPKSFNQYDESLEWIAGGINANIHIKLNKVYSDKIIYNVEVISKDRFDFDTSKNSGFIGLISGIGALLFEEFTWYSTVDFEIEIPNDCEHSFGEWKTAAEPNCTENGMEERTCANCGCAETRATDALGHSFGEWAVETEPSCTESGTERRDCNNCEHYETKEIAPKCHSFGEWYETKEPTYHE